jgi:hypothetical protein
MKRAGALFLVVVCWVFCLLALMGSAGAQETTLQTTVADATTPETTRSDARAPDTTTPDTSAPDTSTPDTTTLGGDAECPGAKVVNTTSGNGDKQSPVFAIAGDSFRVTTTLRSDDPQFIGFDVFVKKEGGQIETSIGRENPGTDSSIVNAGPGGFFLDILAANVDYTVKVEDCTGATGSGGGRQGGTQMGGQHRGPVDNPKGVMPGTGIKKMPKTGGPPYLALGALALLGGALVAGRGILRR